MIKLGMIYKVLVRRTNYNKKTGQIDTVWKEIISARSLSNLKVRIDTYLLKSKYGRKSERLTITSKYPEHF